MMNSSMMKYELSAFRRSGAPYSRSPNSRSPSNYSVSSNVKERKSRVEIEREVDAIIVEIQQGRSTIVLTEKDLSDQQFVKIVEAACKPGSKVTEIDASHNEITFVAIRDLVSVLSQNTQLRVINLSYNSINEQCKVYFLEILRMNFTITCINLFKNPISVPHLSDIMVMLDRNAEYQRELTKAKHYACALSCLDNLISRPLGNLVMEYFNEATDPEVRKKIESQFYPFQPASPSSRVTGRLGLQSQGMETNNNRTAGLVEPPTSIPATDEETTPLISRLQIVNAHFDSVQTENSLAILVEDDNVCHTPLKDEIDKQNTAARISITRLKNGSQNESEWCNSCSIL